MSHSHSTGDKARPFSPVLFVITIVTTLLVIFMVIAAVAPQVWKVQMEAGWGDHTMTFLIFHFINAHMEFFFHRYVLHASLHPWLSGFYKSHTDHHSFTRVRVAKGDLVENKYQIIEDHQHESSFFPWYSLAVFSLIATPFFAVAQWMFPQAPIFLAGNLALAWSVLLYEFLHALEHMTLEKWMPFLEHENPLIKKIARTAYSFHLFHHFAIGFNEGISGFFGIPIADFFFNTLVIFPNLFENGKKIDLGQLALPIPRWPIRVLDGFVKSVMEWRRAKQRA